MNAHFTAPWGQKVRLITLGVLALLVLVGWKAGPVGALVTVAVVAVGLSFSVRGYSVTDAAVLVHHLGWAKRLPLAEITRAEVSPGVTVGSVRTFGVGGLFGFYGRFRNAVLGPYTAYATDPARAVILEMDGRTVVVTPDDPARFVAAVERGRG